VQVAGWTRTVRLQGGGDFSFVSLTDGSTNKDLQIIITKDTKGFDAINDTSSAGSSLRCVGVVQAAPEGADKQKVSLDIF
jgi:aspartyl/asparaginyl-tRNA synthetase